MFSRQAQFAQTPRPDLILLDLQLPKRDGRAVLGDVRSDPALRRIPVVVLTTSQTQWEILKQENLFVESSYLLKPLDQGQFSTVVKSLRRSTCWRTWSCRNRSGQLSAASKPGRSLKADC